MNTSTRIIVCGAFGRMGRAVCQLAAESTDVEVVAGVDILTSHAGLGALSFPAYSSISQVTAQADAIVSFMPPTAIDDTLALLEYGVSHHIPMVICTTGLPALFEQAIADASSKVAILESPNMSLGINLLANMISRAAKLLYDAKFDIEIVEKHHNQKLDSPSGTALMLANTVNDSLGGNMRIVLDRSGAAGKRERDEIGVFALRGGSIVGDHSVIFAGSNEVIEISHSAQSRDTFAVGAIKAAKYLKGKPAGLYNMQNLINEV